MTTTLDDEGAPKGRTLPRHLKMNRQLAAKNGERNGMRQRNKRVPITLAPVGKKKEQP